MRWAGPTSSRLHVQFWFLVVGAVAAVAGLLHRHAPPWLLWPPLLLVLVVPRFGERLLAPQADVLLDVLVVVAALLLVLWLRDRDGWRLAAAAVLLAGAANTKREGILSRGLRARGRVRLLTTTAVATARRCIPLRGSRSPPVADLGGQARHRPRGAVVAVRQRAAERRSRPLVRRSLLERALVGASGRRDDRRSVRLRSGAIGASRGSSGLVALLFFAGGVWSTAGFAELAISADESGNPIVRYTGSIIFLAAAAVPLLLASVWRRSEEP